LNFKQSGENILKIKTDLLVLGIFKGDKLSGSAKSVDEALGGVLKDLSGNEKFEGDMGKTLLLNSTFGRIGAKRVLLLGLGEKSLFSRDTVRKAGNLTAKKMRDASTSMAFGPEFSKGRAYVSALAEGVILGSYEFNKYKTNNGPENEIENVVILSEELKEKKFQEEIETAKAVSESACFARDLVNEPPVYMTPSRLADIASSIADEGDLKCEIFDLEEIKSRGMGGIVAVSSGSAEPPRFIRLTYEPDKNPKTTLAVIGKGITFDSAGYV